MFNVELGSIQGNKIIYDVYDISIHKDTGSRAET